MENRAQPPQSPDEAQSSTDVAGLDRHKSKRRRSALRVLLIATAVAAMAVGGVLAFNAVRGADDAPMPELLDLRSDINWSVTAWNCVSTYSATTEARDRWLPLTRRRMAKAAAQAELAIAEVEGREGELLVLGTGLAEDVLALTNGTPRDVDAMNGRLAVFRAGVLELEGAPEVEVKAALEHTEPPAVSRQECRDHFSRDTA